MKKFKVICTGISGINSLLTPEMGVLDESLLKKGSFDKLVKGKAIVEIEEEINLPSNIDTIKEQLDALKVKYAGNCKEETLQSLLVLCAEVKNNGIEIPEGSGRKEIEELLNPIVPIEDVDIEKAADETPEVVPPVETKETK